MRIKLLEKAGQHTEICTACAWSNGELYTCSDDMNILKWSQEGEMRAKLTTVDAYVTSIAWDGRARAGASSNVFACSCTDGTWRIFNLTGNTAREQKKIQAHSGAVISLKWSHDGNTIVTAGEDGDLKVWSPSGNLRSTLQSAAPVYNFCWGPDGDTILWCSGKALNLKSLSGSGPRKALSWQAHEETVLCLDWNRINELIVSAGEDCVYKVWDAYGRQLYVSPPTAHVITSISWCPNGECFAVGSFDSLRLCDRTGWSYSREQSDSGSFMQLAWTPDGTELAGAGGNGTVVFGQLVDRRLEWQNFEVTLEDSNLIKVQDASNYDFPEPLEYETERVVEMALGWNHLVVATANRCHIYEVKNFNTPIIQKISAPPQLLLLSEKYFLTLESTNLVTVYKYDGTVVSSPRFNGLRPEMLNQKTVALSNDCVAILDRTDSKTVRCFDVITGKPLTGTVVHKTEIVHLALNQSEPTLQERRLSIIDRNSDLFITPVMKQPGIFRGMYKLQTQVDTMAWCDTSDMLCAVADGRFVTWYYPNVVFVDRDLIPATTESKDATDVGKVSQITGFNGNRATIRKGDGALITASVSGFVPKLYNFVKDRRWDESVRLCRFVKDNKLWGCLAVMSIHSGELETAEIALAALNEVDKLYFIQHIKKIPSEQGRSAELAMYRRCPDEAEEILLQATPRLLYRAIKMNIRLFRWTRALSLAEKYSSHVDTVLGYRQKYLEQFEKQETHPKFLAYEKKIEVDWTVIKKKINQEKEDESARSGSIGGGGGK